MDDVWDDLTSGGSGGGNGGGGGSGGGGNGGGGGEGDSEANCPVNDPDCDLSLGDPTSINPNGPPCEQVFSASTCQQISGVISVGVLTLDTVAAIGTGISAILAAIAILGGPIGMGAVAEAYLIANAVEGWMGAASFGLTLANDFLVTGGSYLTLDPEPELVLSADVVISGIFAITGGIDPEPFGDTLINGTAAIYDIYRLRGGDSLFTLHIGLSGWYLDEN